MQCDQPVPDFCASSTAAAQFQLSAQRGSWIMLYFYPKDATPGCSDEGLQFKALHQEFAHASCIILGVSRDGLASHQRFRARLEFPFHLLSDPEEQLCELFKVMRSKNMYGKQVRGIERSTFLIDPAGILRREWRKVGIPGHAQEVLETLRRLSTTASTTAPAH